MVDSIHYLSYRYSCPHSDAEWLGHLESCCGSILPCFLLVEASAAAPSAPLASRLPLHVVSPALCTRWPRNTLPPGSLRPWATRTSWNTYSLTLRSPKKALVPLTGWRPPQARSHTVAAISRPCSWARLTSWSKLALYGPWASTLTGKVGLAAPEPSRRPSTLLGIWSGRKQSKFTP